MRSLSITFQIFTITEVSRGFVLLFAKRRCPTWTEEAHKVLSAVLFRCAAARCLPLLQFLQRVLSLLVF